VDEAPLLKQGGRHRSVMRILQSLVTSVGCLIAAESGCTVDGKLEESTEGGYSGTR
jgi:hypothetical protein